MLSAYMQGNLEKTGEIAESVDLRRIPLHEGKNHEVSLSALRNHPNTYWPMPLFMIHAHLVPEATMIQFLHGIIEAGFNIRQALSIADSPHRRQHINPRDPVIEGAVLLIAIEKTERDVLKYLLGEDFINVWSQSHLELVLETFHVEKLHDDIDLVLNSEVARNIFLAMPEHEKVEFVKYHH